MFNIQTPVCITLAIRTGPKAADEPAAVRYALIEGRRADKFDKLKALRTLKGVKWAACPTGWHDPFTPAGTGNFFAWPKLTDLMPWQHSGLQEKRNWPIGPDADSLRNRWGAMLRMEDRSQAMQSKSEDRPIHRPASTVLAGDDVPEARMCLRDLPWNTAPRPVLRFAFRSFDRQHILADDRLLSRPRAELWASQSDRQLYFTTLSTNPITSGPAVVAAADVPDLHHFRGSFGAKDVLPLYRDAAATEPNILPGLLTAWGKRLGRRVTVDKFAAYLYALLGHPGYEARFRQELTDRTVHVPLTPDGVLYDRADWERSYFTCTRLASG